MMSLSSECQIMEMTWKLQGKTKSEDSCIASKLIILGGKRLPSTRLEMEAKGCADQDYEYI